MGQNSIQKPQDLQRSTTIETRPFATGPHNQERLGTPENRVYYAFLRVRRDVMIVTSASEKEHKISLGRRRCGKWAPVFPKYRILRVAKYITW